MKNKLAITIVDAFTHQLFKGNSAAVIVVEDWLSVSSMQSIALENNLSETAFVKPRSNNEFDIRWFSPLTEIDFCGHATLASSFVIFNDNPQLTSIEFYADAVGKLTITKQSDGFIQMQFPNTMPLSVQDIPAELTQGLSIKPSQVLLNNQAYFVIYDNEDDVINVQSTNELLAKLAPHDVVVTAQATSDKYADYDFISRYFWPANGGDEDPVTGSIHTGLAPYWAKRLNKNTLIAYQASSRGGVLHCKVTDDSVFISGQAVQYLSGEITV